ncbi:DUF2493 domain-containing protein [Geoalkalibacter subterraneus]|uniref:DUF2493 domain-containing protein n=1 Tax=Geoalkalibacter subterraneus TaxID=483547 RepID=UPI000A0604D2|nr:DUF2493 domain-containing protein [Geoalkalibacter subterraneus]
MELHAKEKYVRVIIAGSRTCTDFQLVESAIAASGFVITRIISGGAKGVDQAGEQWARRNDIPIERFDPDWKRFGRGAGPMRNREMAQNADALIAIWDGKSKGTHNMIDLAKRQGLEVFIYPL